MIKAWGDDAWDDYLYFIRFDRKQAAKINKLIKDIERNGCLTGEGKPEALKGDLKGYYSRRIDDTNRLVYYIENNMLFVIQCKGHYGDK